MDSAVAPHGLPVVGTGESGGKLGGPKALKRQRKSPPEL